MYLIKILKNILRNDIHILFNISYQYFRWSKYVNNTRKVQNGTLENSNKREDRQLRSK